MKKITYSWALVLVCAMLTFIACEETIEDDIVPINQNNEDAEIDDDDPDEELKNVNEVLECLKFDGVNLITGDIPASSNSAQFKIDTDTIFWVVGIRKRIRILYPDDFDGEISSILVQVNGADNHLEVNLDETESGDDEGVFYFAYGGSSSCGIPPLFEVDIAVKEESGSIVHVFENKPVVIEESGSNMSPVGQWDWLYTTIDGVMNRAKGYPEVTPGTVKGCCDNGNSFYGNCIGLPTERTVYYEAFFMQTYEFVEFFEDGTLEGVLHEDIRNVDPTQSDFCGNKAGYKDRVIHNIFNGVFSFNQATGKISLSNMDGLYETVTVGSNVYEVPLPLYFGNFLDVEMISSHYMIDRSNAEGMGMERVFERRSTTEEWYD